MDNTIYIRADGNAQIGLGHVMRCLSIAMAARTLGHCCIFVTADDGCRELIERHGFSAYVLHSAWNRLKDELSALCTFLEQNQAQQLLIDSYYVTESYMRLLCEKVKVTYLDDVAAFVYPCHTLINYNVYAKSFYKSSDYTSTQLLIGPEFAPLRPEFQNLPPRILRRKVEDILFTTGGTDSLGVLPEILEDILSNPAFSSIRMHIVVGNFHQYRQVLENISKQYSNVFLYFNINTISKLMQRCDLAVSAGGSTLYELCACGTPSVCFSMADNQLCAVRWFAENHIMLYAGDIRSKNSLCVQQLVMMLAKYIDDLDLRLSFSEKASRLVDGNGAARIIKNLL